MGYGMGGDGGKMEEALIPLVVIQTRIIPYLCNLYCVLIHKCLTFISLLRI